MRVTPFVLSVICVLTPTLAPAQNLIFGSLSGTLTDSAGAVIPGVTIKATNVDTAIVSQR